MGRIELVAEAHQVIARVCSEVEVPDRVFIDPVAQRRVDDVERGLEDGEIAVHQCLALGRIGDGGR